MFDALLPIYKLCLLVLFSFFILFTIRCLFVKKIMFVLLYHAILLCILVVFVIGSGGNLNNDHERLRKFILLEENKELNLAKKNPQNYDVALRMDLLQFKNSDEFKDYIKRSIIIGDRVEAIFIGWLFALLAEISMICVATCQFLSKFMVR